MRLKVSFYRIYYSKSRPLWSMTTTHLCLSWKILNDRHQYRALYDSDINSIYYEIEIRCDFVSSCIYNNACDPRISCVINKLHILSRECSSEATKI